jgi:hypothetical protein
MRDGLADERIRVGHAAHILECPREPSQRRPTAGVLA